MNGGTQTGRILDHMRHTVEVPFEEHKFESAGEAAVVLTVIGGGHHHHGISPSIVKQDPSARDRAYNIAIEALNKQEAEAKEILRAVIADREYLVQAFAFLYTLQKPDCEECDGSGIVSLKTDRTREDTRGATESTCPACRGSGKGEYPAIEAEVDFSAAEQKVVDQL